MLRVFTHPGDAITIAKKIGSTGTSIGVLGLSALIFAIVSALGTTKIMSIFPGAIPYTAGVSTGIAAVVTFVMIFIGGLFFSWILSIVMKVLDTKSSYFAGVTAVAYPLLLLSVANLVAMGAGYVPYFGGIIAFLITLIFTCMAFALTYRAIKDLFKTDMMTAFIGLLVVWAAIIAAGLYGGMAGWLSTIGRIPIYGFLGL
jgi:hypothetical protein